MSPISLQKDMNRPQVWPMHISFLANPFREQIIARWQSFLGQIMVAEEDGAIIGFIAFDETELHALYVLPSYQGKSIGSALLEAAGNVS